MGPTSLFETERYSMQRESAFRESAFRESTVLIELFYLFSQSGKQTFTSYNGTGLAMLFSAGTFLYVATVHILPELLSQPSNSLDNSQTHGKLTRKELCYLVIGIFTPVILGLYHKH